MQSVYLETTICSYLAAWPMGQLVAAARQRVVHQWWRHDRHNDRLFVSQLVVLEAQSGDASASQRRMEILRDIPILEISSAAQALSQRLLAEVGLPAKAAADAMHIAIAATSGMDYLMTLNVRHIANVRFRQAISEVCRDAGLQPPQICTPDEILGEVLEENNEGNNG